jgi:hypothetical protein
MSVPILMKALICWSGDEPFRILATLIPAWAVKILHDATTNGWLQSARGIGALASALLIVPGPFRSGEALASARSPPPNNSA